MPHDVVFHAAAVWLTLIVAACLAMIVRARLGVLRILLVDFLTVVAVGLLVVFAIARDAISLFDVALGLAILSFAGTLAASRFHGRGSLFR